MARASFMEVRVNPSFHFFCAALPPSPYRAARFPKQNERGGCPGANLGGVQTAARGLLSKLEKCPPARHSKVVSWKSKNVINYVSFGLITDITSVDTVRLLRAIFVRFSTRRRGSLVIRHIHFSAR